MINGLPFTRPFMLPFGGPFFKTGEGGGIVEPAGFSAKYLSYLVDSMTLEAGDKVSQWDDQSANNNDITQATSANQPTLIQDANIYNNVVRFDATDDNMTPLPTTSGDFAMQFKKKSDTKNPQALFVEDGGVEYNSSSMILDDTNYLTAPSSPITSLKDSDQTWSIRYKPDSTVSVGTEVIWSVGSGATNVRASRINKNGSTVSVTIFPTIGVTTDFVDLQSSVALVQDQWHTITVQIDVNNTLSITVDGVKDSVAMGNIDINATYPVAIGSSAGSVTCSGAFRAFRVWDRTLSDAEVSENELNSNNVYVSYDSLSTGLKSGLIVDSDLGNYNGSNTPIADNAGTLTFSENGTINYESESPSTLRKLFSSSTTSAEVRISADNVYEVVSDGGTVYTFPITFAETNQEVNIVRREGDYIYVHGSDSYAELAYVAGETFTFDRVSDTANASDSDWQEIRIYDNGLTANEVNYFYYLRNENNEILTPPLLPDAGNEFIFSVKTDNAGGVSANDQFKVGTISAGVYDCTVDWGDGSSDVITTWDDPAWTHTYSVAGTYVITISGTSFTYPYFYLGDDTKVLNVSKWGLTDYGTTALNSFKDCSNLTLTSSDVPDTSSATSIESSWQSCSSLTSFPLIDTSSVTDMSFTWRDCTSLTSFPLIDTSSVTTMFRSWYGCSSLTSFPSLNTSSVTTMQESWRSCSSLISFPLIDTSSATVLQGTWNGCSSLISFPLIDTSSVTVLQGTWNGCSSLTSFPLTDTSSVTNMSFTWLDCTGLTSFPLIDTSSCTNFTDTWKSCALNSDSIDNIMQALVNGGKSNLSTDISGGTNLGFSSWSAGAVANYNTLVNDRGWTITTNP